MQIEERNGRTVVEFVLDNTDIETAERFKKCLIVSGMTEDEFLHDSIWGVLAEFGSKLGSDIWLLNKDLNEYVRKELGMVFEKSNLFQWRKTQWVEGVDYFQSGFGKKPEFLYNLTRILPFLKTKKRYLIQKEKKKVVEAKKAIEEKKIADEESGPKIRGYAESVW